MQYLVKTIGEVLDQQSKAYVVQASSKDEAQKIAQKKFEEDFYNVAGEVRTSSYPRNKLAYFSFLLMGCAIFLSIIGWKTGHDTILIRPNLSSCLYAVLIYSVFVVRIKGVQRALDTGIDIVYCILNVLLLSSFIRIIILDREVNFLGLFDIPIDTTYLIIFAVLFSWLGLKLISVLCMGLVCVLAICNINILTDAMGDIWGTVYVLSSFLGVLIYLRNEPAIYEIEKNTKKISIEALNYLKQDFNLAKSEFDVFEYQKKQEKRKLDDNELKNKETINYEKAKK